MNEQTKQSSNPEARPANQKHAELINQTSRLIARWSGPFLSIVSYGIIIGLSVTGLALMGISVVFGMLFDSGSSSGFAFLTGGVFLAAGTVLFLWKITRALGPLYGNRHKPGTT